MISNINLEKVLKDFREQDPRHIETYMAGYCAIFANALSKIAGISSQVVSVWEFWDNKKNTVWSGDPNDLIWDHDLLEYNGLYWDILGGHTKEEVLIYMKKNFNRTKFEFQLGSGSIDKHLDKKSSPVVKSLLKIKESLGIQ